MAEKKLPTSNYKGTRDFYPEDMVFRNWMFSRMREVVESFGYREYDGPILESIDLFKAKSGQEIVEKQLYDFVDKGDRHVTIRPEMTPTLARMVAAKVRDLPKPIRWFSIPNLWRYEAPGHGRLREHWQLNVDIFGVNSLRAEFEILQLAASILYAFGAKSTDFRIQFSHRRILSDFLQKSLGLPADKEQAVAKILDKKSKITREEFLSLLREVLDNPETQIPLIDRYLESDLTSLTQFPEISPEVIAEMQNFYREMEAVGHSDNLDFDPSIIRGFDYYTGFIFEIFDTDPKNKRSLYGGGRYDNLIGLFSNDQLSGIGFGLGDVTLQNFLETHNLIPEFNRDDSVYIPLLSDSVFLDLVQLTTELRASGITVETSLDVQKMGKQIQNAEKKGFRYLLIFGEDERNEGKVLLKDLKQSSQKPLIREKLAEELKRELGI